jgi:hypothetical protein
MHYALSPIPSVIITRLITESRRREEPSIKIRVGDLGSTHGCFLFENTIQRKVR